MSVIKICTPSDCYPSKYDENIRPNAPVSVNPMNIPDFVSFVRRFNSKLGNFSLMNQSIFSRNDSLTVTISTYKIDVEIHKLPCTMYIHHETNKLFGVQDMVVMFGISSTSPLSSSHIMSVSQLTLDSVYTKTPHPLRKFCESLKNPTSQFQP